MRREDFPANLIGVYEEVCEAVEVFKIKPWEVQIGMKLKFRNPEHLQLLQDNGRLYEPFTSQITKKLNKRFIVDEQMLQKIHSHSRCVVRLDDSSISLPMLELVGEYEQKSEQPETVLEHYSIRKYDKDVKILKEMKEKVDKKRLKQLLSISGTSDGNKVVASNDIVDRYLDLWANGKYEFYVMFGKELKIQTQIESKINVEEMKQLLTGLKLDYPKYALTMEHFDCSDFIHNKIGYISSGLTKTFGDNISSGMKLSKFIAQNFKDPQFDISVSEVLQNKLVKGNIVISIDPYDYLTSSINKHDWRSCHRITDGEYGTGSLSYLLDDCTMIALKENGRIYNYTLTGFKFSGNSKTFRQCVYFDKDSCNIIFGRNYPSKNNEISKTIRNLLEKQVAEYFDVPDIWNCVSNKHFGQYEDISELHYSDVKNEWNFHCVKLKNTSCSDANFKVGANVPCIKCGKLVYSSGEDTLCKYCC